MTAQVLFILLLVSGLILAYISKSYEGKGKAVLIILSILLIGIGGYGIFTSLF